MKLKIPCKTMAALAAALAITQISSAAPVVWSGASTPDLLWATPGNWTPSGPPSATDDAQFFDPGAVFDLSAPNNIVGENRTIQSLWFGQTNGMHYTLIKPGVTLTVTSTNGGNIFIAGTETDNGAAQGETNVISGPGATLAIDDTNAAFVVRQESANGGTYLRSTLDLSGLDNLQANVSRVLVGVEGTLPRPAGTLYLAKTNVITAGGNAPSIAIGGNGGGSHNSGNSSYVLLGQVNAINADSITVGRVKQTGNSSIRFNTNIFPNSIAVFRGADGVSRVGDWRLADAESGSGSGDTVGICDFSGGTVDALVDSMILGRQAGNHSPIGTLTLDQGVFDVNTLTLGLQTSSSTYHASGVVNVVGTGTLIVNSNLVFGQVAGNTGAALTGGTLNIGDSGKVDVRGALTIGGLARINVTNGFLNLPTNSTLALDTLVVDGGTISNATTIVATNQSLASLTIVNGGKLPNAQSFDLGTGGNAQWFPGDSLVFSNSLKGAGLIYSDVTQAPGATLTPGAVGIPGTLFITPNTTPGNLTLDGGQLNFDLSDQAGGLNDSIQVGGTLTLNGANNVVINSLNGGLDTTTPYTLINYATLVGNVSSLHAAGPLSQSRYTFSFSSANPNTIQLSIGGAGTANLLWKGDGTANNWDLKSTANWLNGATADQFFNLDNAIFDDSGSAAPSINLVGSLVPGGITMSNLTKSYTFSGPGNFANGNFTNFGTATVTLSNDNTNTLNFVDLESGTLVLGGNSANNLNTVSINTPATLRIANTNANTFGGSGITLNGGALVFDQPLDASFNAVLANFGTVTKENTNTLTLLGNNSSFSSPITVNAGTIESGAGAAAFGTGGLTINNGAALEINSQNLGAVSVTAIGSGPDGAGAIVNRGVDQTSALSKLTLAGDTTFGGTARWDLRNNSPFLSTGGNGFSITKVGTNQVALVGVSVDPALGDVDIKEGMFAIQTSTVSASGGFGDPSRTITVHPGAMLETYNLGGANPLPKQIVVQDGGTVQNDNGVSVISGGVNITGTAFLNGRGTSLTFSGPISGAGSVVSGGSSILELSGTNTYTGATTVTNGTLEADGIITGSGVTVDSGTLAGIGAINAPVVVNAGGTLSPGTNGIGTLSVSGNLSLAGTTAVDVDSTAGVFTSDVVTNVTTLTLGGTLEVNATGDPLVAGDSFKLFSANSIAGTFASITPAPGAGLQWDQSQISSGILKVATATQAPPTIGNISISGGQVTINGTGGMATSNFYVLASTNLSLPLSSWTSIGTNTFDQSGNFTFSAPADASAPQRFYIIQVP